MARDTLLHCFGSNLESREVDKVLYGAGEHLGKIEKFLHILGDEVDRIRIVSFGTGSSEDERGIEAKVFHEGALRLFRAGQQGTYGLTGRSRRINKQAFYPEAEDLLLSPRLDIQTRNTLEETRAIVADMKRMELTRFIGVAPHHHGPRCLSTIGIEFANSGITHYMNTSEACMDGPEEDAAAIFESPHLPGNNGIRMNQLMARYFRVENKAGFVTELAELFTRWGV